MRPTAECAWRVGACAVRRSNARRPRANEPSETLARPLDGGEHGVLLRFAHQHALQRCGDRSMRRAWQQPACCGIEIRTADGAWKLAGDVCVDGLLINVADRIGSNLYASSD